MKRIACLLMFSLLGLNVFADTNLLQLARDAYVRQGGSITYGEARFLEQLGFDNVADFPEMELGTNVIIDANLIKWLCTDPAAKTKVGQRRGVSVVEGCIVGDLGLDGIDIPFPIDIRNAVFTGMIDLRFSHLRSLRLDGSRVGSLKADAIKVDQFVSLADGFESAGKVQFVGAKIDGDLDCSGGQFANHGDYALVADRARIGGAVLFMSGFKADSRVSLKDAEISGSLECSGGQFNHANTNQNGALVLNNAHVAGDVLLRSGFVANGVVNMMDATVNGNLNCDDGHFFNTGKLSLQAGRAKIEGSVFFRSGFETDGQVSLLGTKIANSLQWRDVKITNTTILDLQWANVGTLWVDTNWPVPTKLFIAGFTFDQMLIGTNNTMERAVDWIHRQRAFSPQPYEHLAGVLKKMGFEDEAVQLMIAKNEDYAKTLPPFSFSRLLWYDTLGRFIGYGFKPLNALWGSFFFILVGWLIFYLGNKSDLFEATDAQAYAAGASGKTTYLKFNSFVYSVENFVPLVKLGVGEYWLPNANDGWAAGSLRWYYRIHIGFGWLLTTLWVGGVTGLIKT